MKGISFQKPLEFGLNVEGESWTQGDPIRGVLKIKNHGPEPIPLSEIHVRLARGDLKRVRQKAADAFDLISPVASDTSGTTISSQGSSEVPWQYKFDSNAPITDKSSSLFLLYGRGDELSSMGQLQLPIQPAPIIQEILKTLSIHHRFVVKTQKAGKTGVEVKLSPPDSKSFATLDYLTMTFRFDPEAPGQLRIRYVFHVKKISATGSAIDVSKQKKDVHQVMAPEDYLTSSGRFHFEHIEAAVAEAISGVESKIAF